MDRLLRIAEYWNWLPAFRAVAETQHLPTAARVLGVSASSLSRTIRLLERALGEELFLREGRQLQLSSRGRRFLSAVRDAMRRVDDGQAALDGTDLRGEIHFAVAGPYSATLAPALERLAVEQPALRPFSHAYAPDQVVSRLLRGDLDFVITPNPVRDERLAVEAYAEVGSSVYCGPTHSLASSSELTLECIRGHAFVAPVFAESGAHADGWPTGVERSVTANVQQLTVAFELCRSGSSLAVFPDILVRSHLDGYGLRRLQIDVIPPTTVYSVRRRPIGNHRDVDTVLEVIRSTWADIADAP